MKRIDIVFDGPPGHDGGRFVEVEDENGRSFRAGEWTEQKDGLWVLRLDLEKLSKRSVGKPTRRH